MVASILGSLGSFGPQRHLSCSNGMADKCCPSKGHPCGRHTGRRDESSSRSQRFANSSGVSCQVATCLRSSRCPFDQKSRLRTLNPTIGEEFRASCTSAEFHDQEGICWIDGSTSCFESWGESVLRGSSLMWPATAPDGLLAKRSYVKRRSRTRWISMDTSISANYSLSTRTQTLRLCRSPSSTSPAPGWPRSKRASELGLQSSPSLRTRRSRRMNLGGGFLPTRTTVRLS